MTTTPEKPGRRPDPGRETDGATRPPPVSWIVGAAVVLGLLVAADAVIDFHPHFGIDGLFGFHAAYGLVSGLFVVVVAKIAGIFLKRTDTYYDAD